MTFPLYKWGSERERYQSFRVTVLHWLCIQVQARQRRPFTVESIGLMLRIAMNLFPFWCNTIIRPYCVCGDAFHWVQDNVNISCTLAWLDAKYWLLGYLCLNCSSPYHSCSPEVSFLWETDEFFYGEHQLSAYVVSIWTGLCCKHLSDNYLFRDKEWVSKWQKRRVSQCPWGPHVLERGTLLSLGLLCLQKHSQPLLYLGEMQWENGW